MTALEGSKNEPRRSSLPRVVRLVVVGAVVFAMAIAVVLVLQVVMLQRQQQLDALNATRSAEIERFQSLRRSVASAENPATVLRRASQELGMVEAPDVIYLTPATIPMGDPFERTIPAPDPDAAQAETLESGAASSELADGGTADSGSTSSSATGTAEPSADSDANSSGNGDSSAPLATESTGQRG